MPRVLLSLTGAIAVGHGLILLKEHEEPPKFPDLVHWVSALAGDATAKKSGKPILYDFSADWCGPCNLMKAEVFADPDVAQMIDRDFVPVRILDEYEGADPAEKKLEDDLRERHGAMGLPTLVVIHGEEARQERGYSERKATVEFLKGGWRTAFDAAPYEQARRKSENGCGSENFTVHCVGSDGGTYHCPTHSQCRPPQECDCPKEHPAVQCDGGACDGGCAYPDWRCQ